MSDLNAKQTVFCEEYLVDLNGTQAAIRAGYSKSSAGSIGSENLQKPEIQAYLQELADKRSKRTEITADNVLRELAKLAFSDPRNLFDVENSLRNIADLDEFTSASISGFDFTRKVTKLDDDEEVEYVSKVKFADKGVNLERLGRHLKLFTDKTELTGKDGGGLNIKWATDG